MESAGQPCAWRMHGLDVGGVYTTHRYASQHTHTHTHTQVMATRILYTCSRFCKALSFLNRLTLALRLCHYGVSCMILLNPISPSPSPSLLSLSLKELTLSLMYRTIIHPPFLRPSHKQSIPFPGMPICQCMDAGVFLLYHA